MVRGCLLAIAVVALIGAWARVVRAGPSSRQRVVLADPDPELRHAMEQALAPWHLEVVIEGPPPADASLAQERADADTARFVVWRDGEQLVVYDRELDTIERRDSRAGVLDPPTAAAAALTIKTMMRLPPPPPLPDETPAPAPAPVADEPGIEVRLQAGAATRILSGGDAARSMRLGGAVAIRPWPRAGWRFGITGDLGTAIDVEHASFKGTWRDWAAFGFVSWTYAHGAWELEPHAGFGIRGSNLDGAEMNIPRTEAELLPTLRGGLWARWRYARWSLGAILAVDHAFGTPTYMKTTAGNANVFQVPDLGIDIGGLIAVDL